ncbi:MAG: flagellar motor switch protein FliM [Woeseiaceae bacterium]
MTDQVLTDEEKGALLEGMSSGEVEVHSNKGPTYAEVAPFEIGPRSRINTNSYPRLQSLNRQFAGRMSKQVELLLNADSSVTFVGLSSCTYSDACEQNEGLSLVVEFSPKPLEGSALITLNAAAVGNLVETFYGGQGNDPARQEAEFFTPGEVSVAALFGEAVISVIGEVWAPLAKLVPEVVGTHLSSGVIDGLDAGDSVISTEFTLEFADKQQFFHVLWPVNTVASLLPVFEGQKRDRDTAEDARWERSLRSRVTDSVVRISSDVGQTCMTLGAVADLEPGDVINIGSPQKGTVSARQIPILRGRFGVHDGRYAMEAINWLESEPGSPATNN